MRSMMETGRGRVDPRSGGSQVGAALHDRPAIPANQLAVTPIEPIRVADLAAVVAIPLGRALAGRIRLLRGVRCLGHSRRYGTVGEGAHRFVRRQSVTTLA